VVTTGQALTLLARLDYEAGLQEPAAEHARQALAVHRGTGHRLGEAKTLLLLDQLGELAELGETQAL
jgi:hypothetical protein